ncbi:MAG: transcription termination factor Rho [Acidimicrobiales bacterium]|nr:transcription termination factor Rho [Acidimicrobiales bacterium]
MSVESTDLERTALERKDRDELVTIAEAMGGKPGSRASKAKVVDLILDLAGVTEPGSDDASTAASDGSAAESTPVEAAEAPSARAESDDDGDGSEGGDASDDEHSGAGAAPSDNGADRPKAKAKDKEKGKAQGQDGGAGKGEGSGKGAADQGRDHGERDAHDAAGDGNERDQDRGRGQQGGDEVDAGNRRRRRRGRNDRPGGDEPWQGEPIPVEGLLDLREEGYGFLRLNGFLASKDDVYVSVKQVRQFSLRKGDVVKGASRPANRNEKNPALLHIDEVNGQTPDEARARPRFDDLTALFPDDKLRLEAPNDPYNMTARIIDLISPIGKGTRGLIVSPPKAGKTTVMKQIARSIETNNPEVHLIVLLVDERPEEVTDMRRWVKNGEVAASTFDRPTEEHTQVAELTIERAKRLVETGKDVVIILDGITRLARAYNLAAPTSGRVMSGGIDTGALYPPKKFFGAARNLEEGGSLTILATALVDTGSRMDEVIFEEFKGTGNMELRLDRRMAERRIYPAIDVDASSTRHEELLFKPKELQQVWKLRRVLTALDGGNGAGLELLIDRMKTFKSNDAFLDEIAKAASAG